MSGPWEDYAGSADDGPWSDYSTAKAPAKRTAPKRSFGENFAGAMANVNRGLVIGDEIQGGLRAVENVVRGKSKIDTSSAPNIFSSIGGAFKQGMSEQRAQEDQFSAEHPVIANQARGAGMAATAAIPAGGTANLFANAGRVANAARGATTAGLTAGGMAAADRGTGAERLQAAGEVARNPFVLGLGAAGGALASRGAVKPKKVKPQVPSVDQLKSQRGAAYDAVEASGHRYAPEAFGKLANDIERDMATARFDADFHPTAGKMLEKIKARAEQGWAPTLSELDDLRKFVNENVTSSMNRTEKMFGRKMVDQIDQFIESQGGDAAGLIGKARNLHARYRKVEGVQDAVSRAERRAGSTGSGGNVDNAIRQNLRTFMEKAPNLSPEEKAALERVVMGTKGQNLLRQGGKLSPQGNGLMLAGHLAAAVPSGGSSGVVALGGAAAKAGADAITRRNVQEVIRIMATDKAGAAELQEAAKLLAKIQTNDPGIAALRRTIAARLSRAAGVAGAGSSRRPTVEAEVVGHPEYGVDRSYGPAGR